MQKVMSGELPSIIYSINLCPSTPQTFYLYAVPFELVSNYQPAAIQQLIEGIAQNEKYQVHTMVL
jgi:hypothetical protein